MNLFRMSIVLLAILFAWIANVSRGYLAFGGEMLLVVIAVVWLIVEITKERKNKKCYGKTKKKH